MAIENENKRNIKFVNNIWITGIHNNKEVVGRTCILNGNNMVTIVTEEALPLIIDFKEIKNLFKIGFVTKPKLENKPQIKINNPITISSLQNYVDKFFN